jgi:hypothetical protein
MVMFPALRPEGFCCGQGQRIGEGRSISPSAAQLVVPANAGITIGGHFAKKAATAITLPPRAQRGMGPGVRRDDSNYADAVVTPPSTTIVWPVMKVEASEAR